MILPADALQILRTDERAKWNRDGTTTKQYVVTFMVGHNGPFSESFDALTFTATLRDARLQLLAQQLYAGPPVKT